MFTFELEQRVKLEMTNEAGKVIGQARYSEESTRYFVRYVAADGRQVTDWFTAQALRDAEPQDDTVES